MRKLLFLSLLWPSSLLAQIPIEVIVGHKQLQHEFFFFEDFDQKARWSLFSMGRFAVDYEDSQRNSSFISSQVTYNFTTSWGLSSGAIYSEGDFAPILAVSYVYTNQSGNLFINLFPTWIIRDKAEYELFGLVFFTPKLNDKLNLFSQLIFGSIMNHRLNEHLFSYQQVRLGVDLVGKFQGGFGLDQNIIGGSAEVPSNYTYNLGIFLRKEF